MKRVLLASLITLAAAAPGCGDTPQGQPPPWATGGQSPAAAAGVQVAPPSAPGTLGASAPAGPGSGAAQAPVAGQAVAQDEVRTRTLAEVRARKWKNEDFVEGDTNRDPFHSFIADFSGGPTIEARQYDVFLSKFSLDELKLAMITGPRGGGGRLGRYKRQKNDPECDVRPCAMFIDGTGNGVTVSSNFHISKSDAKVTRIDPERGQVIVELKEDMGNGKSRTVSRVLEMHPTAEGQNQ